MSLRKCIRLAAETGNSVAVNDPRRRRTLIDSGLRAYADCRWAASVWCGSPNHLPLSARTLPPCVTRRRHLIAAELIGRFVPRSTQIHNVTDERISRWRDDTAQRGIALMIGLRQYGRLAEYCCCCCCCNYRPTSSCLAGLLSVVTRCFIGTPEWTISICGAVLYATYVPILSHN